MCAYISFSGTDHSCGKLTPLPSKPRYKTQMLHLVYLKKKKHRKTQHRPFITLFGVSSFFSAVSFWSLLFKTKVEQMNPSVLTFRCQQCFSWDEINCQALSSCVISAVQLSTPPAPHAASASTLCPTGSLCECRFQCSAREWVYFAALLPLVSLPLPPPFFLTAQLICDLFSVGKKLEGVTLFLKGLSDIGWLCFFFFLLPP